MDIGRLQNCVTSLRPVQQQHQNRIHLGSQLAKADSYGWSASFGGASSFPLVPLTYSRPNQVRFFSGIIELEGSFLFVPDLGCYAANQVPLKAGMIQAGWTRRSKGPLEPPSGKKSWKQRHEKFMKPFILDVFISSKYVHAKVVHRLTSKVVSVATTNAKDLRLSMYSLTDMNACKVVGKLLAERSIEADVFAVTFNLRRGEKFEGKLALVVHTLIENGVALV